MWWSPYLEREKERQVERNKWDRDSLERDSCGLDSNKEREREREREIRDQCICTNNVPACLHTINHKLLYYMSNYGEKDREDGTFHFTFPIGREMHWEITRWHIQKRRRKVKKGQKRKVKKKKKIDRVRESAHNIKHTWWYPHTHTHTHTWEGNVSLSIHFLLMNREEGLIRVFLCEISVPCALMLKEAFHHRSQGVEHTIELGREACHISIVGGNVQERAINQLVKCLDERHDDVQEADLMVLAFEGSCPHLCKRAHHVYVILENQAFIAAVQIAYHRAQEHVCGCWRGKHLCHTSRSKHFVQSWVLPSHGPLNERRDCLSKARSPRDHLCLHGLFMAWIPITQRHPWLGWLSKREIERERPPHTHTHKQRVRQ